MNIGIDIDDTISNTLEVSIDYARKYVKNDLHRNVKEDYNSSKDHNYIRSIFGLSRAEESDFWSKYFIPTAKEVVPKAGSVEAINKLKEEGNKIIIVTARWNQEGFDAKEDSEKWLKKQGIKYDKIITNATNPGEKAEVAKKEKLDVFIDDSIQNCEEVADSGTKSFLFTTKANEYYDMKKATRVNSWKEIFDKIGKEN